MSQAEGAEDVPVPYKRILVANRADAAVRVFATCRALGITTLGVAPADDLEALHTRHCDELLTLPGTGPSAYLDVDELVGAAVRAGADALHPGWGFRAESHELAHACWEHNIVFLGPSDQALKLLGDKTRARTLARTCGAPVIPGTDTSTDLAALTAFWDEQSREVGPGLAVMLKARSGGGGRGIRVVESKADLEGAFRAATAEAQAAFGSGALYVERLLTGARHVEVQLAGDSHGRVRHLWDRECSVQRQHQKLVEVAPAAVLPEHARSRMLQAATRIGAAAGLVGLATVEFLATAEGDFWFVECNPRLQVEHTVTEQVLGMDLVALQLQLASGVALAELGIEAGRGPAPRGVAVQVRVNAERVQPDGSVLPGTGRIRQLDLPSGSGIRVDPAVSRGSVVGTRYDTALAKVVAHGPNLAAAVRLAAGALAETSVTGVATNVAVQRAVLEHPDLLAGQCDTGWFARNAGALLERAARWEKPADAEPPTTSEPASAVGSQAEPHEWPSTPTVPASRDTAAPRTGSDLASAARPTGSGFAPAARPTAPVPPSVAVETSSSRGVGGPAHRTPPESGGTLRAHLTGTVVALAVAPGDLVSAGDELLLIEAMKMQHPVLAPDAGRVARVDVVAGQMVTEGQPLIDLAPVAATDSHATSHPGAALNHGPTAAPTTPPSDERTTSAWHTVTPGASPRPPAPGTGTTDGDAAVRPDLARVRSAHEQLHDAARPHAVAARRSQGRRTARENVDAVTDDGLLVEYGGLAVAAQRRRRSLDELVTRTPADGIVTGLGRVNADLFGAERATCAIAAYDYTVLAGTQGIHSHAKLDRILGVAERQGHPVILFAEGGGGRPNDTDVPVVAGLHVTSFAALGRLSGRVPLIGIAVGRCFAGNAALLGTCDVVIATRDSSIGMGGPAMIEGGGLGVVAPDEVGPIHVQAANGVVDVVVADEVAAAAVARQYLGYVQGSVPSWEAPDRTVLRHVVPEDRKRVYDVRSAVHGVADVGSVLELRREFGAAAVTALARVEGRTVGIIANQPLVNGGAIDAAAADKLARFLQLCDAYALPVVSLCDTPGFMVGPDSEKQATVRHFPRLFVVGAHLSVPLVAVVLRKAYGLGAMAMAGGGFHQTAATLSWPSGEFGAMGLEGAVRLGARDRLAAIEDPHERERAFEDLVAKAYERGSALNTARHLEIDDVIDPADTRGAVVAALATAAMPRLDGWVNAARRPGIDPW